MAASVVTGAVGLTAIAGGAASEVVSGGAASEVAVPLMSVGAQTMTVAAAEALGAHILMSKGAPPVKKVSPNGADAKAPETAPEQAKKPPVPEANPAAGSARPVTVKPSKSPDPNAVPRGPRAKFNSKDDAETVRGAIRENEAADTLAKNGYDVEQKPKVPGLKKPDYRIEGEIFDCYAPKQGAKVRHIGDTITDKVNKQQADRIILNLDDWGGNVEDIRKQLTDYPVNGLKEVKIVKGGSVVDFYP